jgi:exopolysaccharide biosynthesis polyprenyl glycosylphosphotransferase
VSIVTAAVSSTKEHVKALPADAAGALLAPDAERAPASTLRAPGSSHTRSIPSELALALDSLLLAAAGVAATLGASSAGVTPLPLIWTVVFAASVVIFFALRGLYTARVRIRPLDELREVLLGLGTCSVLTIVGRSFSVQGSEAFAEVLRMFVFGVVYVGASRVALARWQKHMRRNVVARRRTLVLGEGRSAALAVERLRRTPELGLEPIGFVTDDSGSAGPVPILGIADDLELIVHEYRIEQLVVASSALPEERIVAIVDQCQERGIPVAFVPHVTEKTTRRLHVEHLGGLPIVFLDHRDPNGWAFMVKYATDRVLALVFLVLLLPVFVAAGCAVWWSLGRPIFYRQRRIGRDGAEFFLLKLRSMKIADGEDSRVCRVNGDVGPGGVEGTDRRTRVGTLLRRTSIDELPQLLNVIRGEMSLVGPRPERPEFARQFTEFVNRYDKRHRVKSGITGWAQIHGLRGRTSVAERVEWDNHYIENWSLWLDFKIFIWTLPAVVAAFRSVE